MPDVLTPAQRSRNMRAIKGRDTGPELTVRRLLHAMGYRFRLHRRDACPRGRSEPSTRRAFWRAKFAANVKRDRRTVRALRRNGWRVLVVWECQSRNADKLAARLRRFIEK
jgi:DNA mismatch endonuclease (patch repair protein)